MLIFSVSPYVRDGYVFQELPLSVFSKKNPYDLFFSALTAAASLTVIVFIIGILWVLVSRSYPALEKFGVFNFI